MLKDFINTNQLDMSIAGNNADKMLILNLAKDKLILWDIKNSKILYEKDIPVEKYVLFEHMALIKETKDGKKNYQLIDTLNRTETDLGDIQGYGVDMNKDFLSCIYASDKLSLYRLDLKTKELKSYNLEEEKDDYYAEDVLSDDKEYTAFVLESKRRGDYNLYIYKNMNKERVVRLPILPSNIVQTDREVVVYNNEQVYSVGKRDGNCNLIYKKEKDNFIFDVKAKNKLLLIRMLDHMIIRDGSEIRREDYICADIYKGEIFAIDRDGCLIKKSKKKNVGIEI